MPESETQARPAVDYSTCFHCEGGVYFCACAEPELAKQMDAELEEARAEIEAENRPVVPDGEYVEMTDAPTVTMECRHWASGERVVLMPGSEWDRLQADLARVTAERDATAGVVIAARGVVNCVEIDEPQPWDRTDEHINGGGCLVELRDSVARLDVAQQEPADA